MSLTTTKLLAGSLLVIGTLAIASNWLSAPAQAAGDDGKTIVLTAQSAEPGDSSTVVALLSDDEREGQRKSAEGEGQRRSPEAETGRRRSPEAEAGPRRSAEGERGPRRSAEGEGSREANSALKGFKPQSQREAALYQMILQLQREVAAMRRELQGRRGTSDGEGGQRGPRDGESAKQGPRDGETPALAAGWQKTKAGGVFRSYDKNGDLFVALDEWLAMTNGNISATRRELQTKRFRETGPGSDNKLSPAEFINWWNRREGAQRGRRDGEGAKRGPRDGEGGRSAESEAGSRRSAEGEGERRSPKAEAGRRRSDERGN